MGWCIPMEPVRRKNRGSMRMSRLNEFRGEITAFICGAADDVTTIVGHLEPLILRLFAFSSMFYVLLKVLGWH